MNSFFQDEFINSKVLSRLAKEIRREQLDCAISELGYLNELQSHIISKSDFGKEIHSYVKGKSYFSLLRWS